MENKNGQGIFLGVVGVATLVVAIIGATFAFFNAQATSGENDITGQTMGAQGGVLSLTVEKVWTAPTQASSLDLVPTNVNISTNLQAALTAKCEATSGVGTDTTKYTGCHVYRITVASDSDMAGADLTLTELTTTSASNAAKWHYGFFTATEATQGTLTAASPITGAAGTFNVGTGNTVESVEVFSGQALTQAANQRKLVRYLIIYVENVETVQNAADGNDVTGSYTGVITATTAGGSTVKATFS